MRARTHIVGVQISPHEVCSDEQLVGSPYAELRTSIRDEFARHLVRFKTLQVDLPETIFGSTDDAYFANTIFKTSDPSSELRELAFPNGQRRKLRFVSRRCGAASLLVAS